MNAEKNRAAGIAAAVLIVLFFVLAGRLYQLQVIKGKLYDRLSNDNRLKVEKLPAPRGIIFDRNGIPLVKNSEYFSLSMMPDQLYRDNLYLIAEFAGMDYLEVKRVSDRWKNSKEPIKLKDGLSFQEVAYAEARLSDYPAIKVEVEQSRHYIYGQAGAHLIGYLSKITPKQAEQADFLDVPRQALVGQWGAEKTFDGILRGVPGRRITEVDALGRKLRDIETIPPQKGDDITLSIDINAQLAAEEAFENKTGALVAIKPATGEMLALLSRPSFNPNMFAHGIRKEDWLTLSAGENKFPLLNRAFQSQYPPGSTFKIITSIAALEGGFMNADTRVTCTGGLRSGSRVWGCWKKGGHGTVSLHRALVESCDVYYYTAGIKAGPDEIARYARMLGLGAETGIGVFTEKKGIIPDTKWKLQTKKEPWYQGETLNTAIGQGYVSVTPAQLARMTAAVANGGYMQELSISKVQGAQPEGRKLDISQETLMLIKEGLRGVVGEPSGTAHAADSKEFIISGKTGTAQVVAARDNKLSNPEKFRDHAWFVAFAPYENPEIALCVFVEHGGHGGSAAAPIAKKVIEAYLNGLKKIAENMDKGLVSEDRPQAD